MLRRSQYASKGLLEDLWPYIDADPEYSRDKLMSQPLIAAQTDGKLYRLPIDFGVTTAVGLGKVVGEYTTWTLADVNDALSKLPEGATVFNKYYTQAEMLQHCVAMNAESFMNWQDGTCSFDSTNSARFWSLSSRFRRITTGSRIRTTMKAIIPPEKRQAAALSDVTFRFQTICTIPLPH